MKTHCSDESSAFKENPVVRPLRVELCQLQCHSVVLPGDQDDAGQEDAGQDNADWDDADQDDTD